MDTSRRGVLTAGLYSAALAVPLFAGEAYAEERERSERPTGRIGAAEVVTARTTTDRIADILDELGAGHARSKAAAFQVNTVAPYLRASAAGPVRRDMVSAASDLTYLTGWMAMYERAHGLGQQYYVKALRLAQEAADQVTHCRTLRGMSLQASNLRHGQKALELADSAAEAAPDAGPRLVAFLRGQQAHYVGLSPASGDEHFETTRKRIAPYGKLRAARELKERSRQVEGEGAACTRAHRHAAPDVPNGCETMPQGLVGVPGIAVQVNAYTRHRHGYGAVYVAGLLEELEACHFPGRACLVPVTC